MAIKAIDIVLVPPKEIQVLCFAVNKAAAKVAKSRFEFGQNDYVPHITLILGCVEETSIPKIQKLLQQLVVDYSVLDLELSGFGLYEKLNVQKKAYFQIELNDKLLALHTKVAEIVRPYLLPCKDASVLVEGEKTGISESSSRFLNNFLKDYAFENYHAHISLGCFDFEEKEMLLENISLPIKFKASTVSIYQIGDGCTCREELYSVQLE
ncbi:hypothetical protein HOA92_07395 [archaeon]|jgi:hypothetical protein|nr:hypothetical protein [archaeon]MBT6762838.1 hypothetical protein [archaeon]